MNLHGLLLKMKKRETNRWLKERKDSKGRLLCLVPTCNKIRQKYKSTDNTRNYCEDHTYWDIREFTNWASLREKALNRDNNTCVKCGDNRNYVEVIVKYKWCINLMERLSQMGGKFKYEQRERKEMRGNFIGDHIIPIALGGDEWDLNNIQTLCLACNKIKTSKDMKDIAIQRKKERFK